MEEFSNMKKLLFLSLFLLVLTTTQANFVSATERIESVDQDKDGRSDTWKIYSAKGTLRQIAKDTNKDGKPDQFLTMLKGRNLILKEYDRNFDGKIDKRQLVEWSPTRLKIPGQPPIPGYVPLWTEEDNNFDGKIDSYTERGNKNPSKERIGKPMDWRPAPAREEKKPSQSDDGLSPEERRIKNFSDQHGIKS